MISRCNNFEGTENGVMGTAVGDAAKVSTRLWLVDDDKAYRRSLAELLEGTGEFECSRQFPSAEAVIEALSREMPPDAILLDFNMGGMTGLDALGPIKALVSTTPVLMLTTFSNPTVRALALRSGASDYLIKIFNVEEIAERIRQACRRAASGEGIAVAVGENHSEGAPAPEARSISVWPERRAPIAGVERHRSDDISQAHAEQGRPTVRWRSVSFGLARGVRYLRSLVFARSCELSSSPLVQLSPLEAAVNSVVLAATKVRKRKLERTRQPSASPPRRLSFLRPFSAAIHGWARRKKTLHSAELKGMNS
jgi:DNA-binding response OmpR family regulator